MTQTKTAPDAADLLPRVDANTHRSMSVPESTMEKTRISHARLWVVAMASALALAPVPSRGQEPPERPARPARDSERVRAPRAPLAEPAPRPALAPLAFPTPHDLDFDSP